MLSYPLISLYTLRGLHFLVFIAQNKLISWGCIFGLYLFSRMKIILRICRLLKFSECFLNWHIWFYMILSIRFPDHSCFQVFWLLGLWKISLNECSRRTLILNLLTSFSIFSCIQKVNKATWFLSWYKMKEAWLVSVILN